jgi:hypothetical protein
MATAKVTLVMRMAPKVIQLLYYIQTRALDHPPLVLRFQEWEEL